jgi:5-methyltetrahydropteroyltriglutamate--homocysteine methyltransferase
MAMTLHADHVGSLLRPKELLDARQAQQAGRISPERLREIEDASILQALDMQKQAGIQIFTDGEYRRETFLDPGVQGIDGLVVQPPNTAGLQWHGPHSGLANDAADEGTQVFLTRGVADKLRRAGRLTGAEGAFMSGHAPGAWKITMPGPMMRANQIFRPGLSDKVYDSPVAVARDLALIMAEEVRDLAREGAAYFQLDSLMYVRPLPPEFLAQVVELDNIVLDAAREAGMTVGLHMCRGNNRSSWLSEGSYEPNAEQAFGNLRADRFLLEYDTDRAGGFEPLRFMPRDKVVVLGLVSSKVPDLESLEALRWRIDEAAKYVPMENLAISPQCGFASSLLGNLLSWDEQRRKLELVSETAQKVWG